MDNVLAYLALNLRQFHEFSLRGRVVLTQLPLSATVLLIVVGSLIFHPQIFDHPAFVLGTALQALLLLLCFVIPWDRLPYPSFLIIPLLAFLPIGLMRHGAGSVITGVGLLAVFPIVWLAASGLYPRATLAAGFLATLAVVWVPVFVTEVAVSPATLTQSFLLPFIMLAIGITIRVMTSSMMTQQAVVEEKDRELQVLLEASARRELLLNTLVNSVDVGLLAVDEEGRPLLTNRKLQHFYTLAAAHPDQAESEDNLLIFQNDGRSAIPESLRPSRRAAEGQVFSDYLLWWGAQPNQRVLSTSSRLMISRTGSREGSVVTFNDVTELVAALNAKEEFVATVSHELRTPLTAIRGYVELLGSLPGLPPDAVTGLEVVSRNSDRLHKLVSDLLAAAERPSEVHPVRIDFSALLAQRVASARERTANPLVNFREVAHQELMVQCDPARIAQVLDNLLSNAVKYSPSGGTVTASASAADGVLECRIEDEGTGMSEEEMAGIFSKFFRTSAARNAAIPGVGLGLAISRAIVERHGGTLSAESIEGRGSALTFQLPMELSLDRHLDPVDECGGSSRETVGEPVAGPVRSP